MQKIKDERRKVKKTKRKGGKKECKKQRMNGKGRKLERNKG
jgi:hypothetical protein